MRQKILMTTIAALLPLLVACGGGQASQAAPTSAPVASTAVRSTSAPAATAAADATAAPARVTAVTEPLPTTAAGAPTAAASTNTSGLRTFAIVPEQTEASYDVQEQFLNQNVPVRAIGKTNVVSGTFRFTADGQPTGEVTKIVVDLRTLTSDSGRRDGAIRSRWLESDTYPYAEFVSTGVEGVPASYTSGQDVTFKLNGTMTIRKVTKPMTFDVTGKLDGNTVIGSATTTLLMRDFGFEPPDIAGILKVEDGVNVRINFTAKAQ